MLNVKISCEIKNDIFGKPEQLSCDYFLHLSGLSVEKMYLPIASSTNNTISIKFEQPGGGKSSNHVSHRQREING